MRALPDFARSLTHLGVRSLPRSPAPSPGRPRSALRLTSPACKRTMTTADSLRGRDLLSVADLSAAEVERVFGTAAALKAEFGVDRRHEVLPLAGRTLAMLFQKPSLRTRVTFEAGMVQLGGHAIYLTHDVVLGARESVRDVARNLDRFVDGIVVRTGPHEVALELAAQAEHPGHQRPDPAGASVPGPGRRVHDARAVRATRRDWSWPSSAMATTSITRSRCSGRRWGWRSVWRIPVGYGPNERIVARATRAGRRVGWSVDVRARSASRPSEGLQSSTRTRGPRWVRRRRPRTAATRSRASGVDDALLDAAGSDAVAMHCLPAHRGEEITSAVMDGPRSLIWDQSENRLHVQKGLLVEVLGGSGGRGERGPVRAVQGRAPARARCGPARAARRRGGRVSRGGSDRAGPRPAVRRAWRRAVASRADRRGPGGLLGRARACPIGRGRDAGRADVLAAVGRRAEAADTLDRLAAILEREGRLADACDVARRALELAESRGRRTHVEDLSRACGRRRVMLRRPRPSSVRSACWIRSPASLRWRPPTTLEGALSDAVAVPSIPTAARSSPSDARRRGGPRSRRSRRGSPTCPCRRHGSSGRRSVPCRDGCLLPGAGDPAVRSRHPPAPRRAVPRSRLARPGSRQAGPARAPGATHRRRRDPARLCYLAAARFPDDARLAAVCA